MDTDFPEESTPSTRTKTERRSKKSEQQFDTTDYDREMAKPENWKQDPKHEHSSIYIGPRFDRNRQLIPKYMKKKDIDAFVDKLPDNKLGYLSSDYEGVYGVLPQLFELCRGIVRRDHGYENKNSETEKAKKAAEEVKLEFEQIMALIPQVTEEESAMAINILRMMDWPYMRVFGDRMQYTEVDYDWIKVKNDQRNWNLEEAIKTYWHKEPTLKIKHHRFLYKQFLYKFDIPTYFTSLDPDQISHNVQYHKDYNGWKDRTEPLK